MKTLLMSVVLASTFAVGTVWADSGTGSAAATVATNTTTESAATKGTVGSNLTAAFDNAVDWTKSSAKSGAQWTKDNAQSAAKWTSETTQQTSQKVGKHLESLGKDMQGS